MDPHLSYWSMALLNMWIVVGFALRGLVLIRRGDVPHHRRCMLTAASLVGLFVVSYVFKLLFLGREDLRVWQAWAVDTLRIHELFVAIMLLAGARAGWLAYKFRKLERDLDPPVALVRAVRASHRFAGRAAVIAAVLGVLTACVVWGSMVFRN